MNIRIVLKEFDHNGEKIHNLEIADSNAVEYEEEAVLVEYTKLTTHGPVKMTRAYPLSSILFVEMEGWDVED